MTAKKARGLFGVGALALTDHDCVDGLNDAIAAGAKRSGNEEDVCDQLQGFAPS